MKQNQDNWGKIINITDDYQPNADLANEAIAKINQRESTVKFKKTMPIWCTVAVCLMLCVVILITCIFTNKKEVLYLSDESLNLNEIIDINDFVDTNNLSIQYINSIDSYNKCATLKENGRVAYIEQNFYYVGNNSFEQVILKIVLIKATYEFSENYIDLTNILYVDSVEAKYCIVQRNMRQNLYSKFSIGAIDYYLEIEDFHDQDDALTGVINLLLNN